MKQKMNEFSVALGLFDYINPIFYSITTITILKNIVVNASKINYYCYLIGGIISIIFGLLIPTVKFIVGLGIMKFKMPVHLVFSVNTGILISGLALFVYVLKINYIVAFIIFLVILGLLIKIYSKTKKFNTIAVLAGTCGYVLIYISLIILAISLHKILNVILYIIAIILFVYLCLVGIKSDLSKPKVHWVIEIANVLCQGLVALSTVLLIK